MARLETYLVEKGTTQAEFAELVQSTPSTISRICSGKRFPGRELLARIVKATGGEVSVSDLLRIESSQSSARPKKVSSRKIGKNCGVV